MQTRPPTTRSKARLTLMLKRPSSTWPTSSSGMPSTSSTSARELTTSNRRGTMLTLHAGVRAGAHDAQEVVVARAREGDDDAVDVVLRDDPVQVRRATR